ncbi:expressed unknown protein [Seminavis robusta]|uniref:Uncharacterized protein n=1 Tax=Seminavis robusta TaxID=568900 RepID=A0A9N8EP49_9STRA|nr:expressed unknown protein [Seminavis robusta]|eukprot:Sro1270_g257950.1 n/a (739) ;mRNA; r:12576-14967
MTDLIEQQPQQETTVDPLGMDTDDLFGLGLILGDNSDASMASSGEPKVYLEDHHVVLKAHSKPTEATKIFKEKVRFVCGRNELKDDVIESIKALQDAYYACRNSGAVKKTSFWVSVDKAQHEGKFEEWTIANAREDIRYIKAPQGKKGKEVAVVQANNNCLRDEIKNNGGRSTESRRKRAKPDQVVVLEEEPERSAPPMPVPSLSVAVQPKFALQGLEGLQGHAMNVCEAWINESKDWAERVVKRCLVDKFEEDVKEYDTFLKQNPVPMTNQMDEDYNRHRQETHNSLLVDILNRLGNRMVEWYDENYRARTSRASASQRSTNQGPNGDGHDRKPHLGGGPNGSAGGGGGGADFPPFRSDFACRGCSGGPGDENSHMDDSYEDSDSDWDSSSNFTDWDDDEEEEDLTSVTSLTCDGSLELAVSGLEILVRPENDAEQALQIECTVDAKDLQLLQLDDFNVPIAQHVVELGPHVYDDHPYAYYDLFSGVISIESSDASLDSSAHDVPVASPHSLASNDGNGLQAYMDADATEASESIAYKASPFEQLALATAENPSDDDLTEKDAEALISSVSGSDPIVGSVCHLRNDSCSGSAQHEAAKTPFVSEAESGYQKKLTKQCIHHCDSTEIKIPERLVEFGDDRIFWQRQDMKTSKNDVDETARAPPKRTSSRLSSFQIRLKSLGRMGCWLDKTYAGKSSCSLHPRRRQSLFVDPQFRLDSDDETEGTDVEDLLSLDHEIKS